MSQYHKGSYNMADLEEYISHQVQESEMYTKERMEIFGTKWHIWLKNVIEDALRALGVWVDENIVEQIKERILRRIK